jgi:site-specific DNA-adenine methylase
MKNHFIFPYSGNKRQEVEKIHEYLKDKLDGVDTIIEPFCGSSAMSCYLSQLYPRKFKYVLNDMDEKLIELYVLMKDKEKFKEFMILFNETVKLIINKEAYLAIIREPTLLAWVIKHRIYRITVGLYPIGYIPKIYNFDACCILHFLQTEDVTLTCGDGCDLMITYENERNVLLFLDPPYIMSCNLVYKEQYTNIYEYCSNNSIDEKQSKILFVLEDNWIIRLIFNKKVKSSYYKRYDAGSKKKTSHIIIDNIN